MICIKSSATYEIVTHTMILLTIKKKSLFGSSLILLFAIMYIEKNQFAHYIFARASDSVMLNISGLFILMTSGINVKLVKT